MKQEKNQNIKNNIIIVFFMVSGILIAVIINLKNRKLQLSMGDLFTGILPPWAQVGEGTLDDYEKRRRKKKQIKLYSFVQRI